MELARFFMETEKFLIENSKLIKYNGMESAIIIPNGITEIGDRAFEQNPIIESVIIPDSVTSIGELAFHSCPKLRIVEIPETLKNIASNAFNSCSKHLRVTTRKVNSKKTESESVDYKELFIKAFYAKELSDKENIFKQVNDESIKIPFAVFLFTEFESKTACDYIIENSQKVLHYLVDENKIEVMSKIIPILNQKKQLSTVGLVPCDKI
ncbi:MAG: leucine-rich repeat domain-containing protein [Ruminococcus sp.]